MRREHGKVENHWCGVSEDRRMNFCIPISWQYNRPTNSFRMVILDTYLLTCLLTGARALLEKLTSSQLVKKSPAFYGTQRFMTAFTRARHLSLS